MYQIIRGASRNEITYFIGTFDGRPFFGDDFSQLAKIRFRQRGKCWLNFLIFLRILDFFLNLFFNRYFADFLKSTMLQVYKLFVKVKKIREIAKVSTYIGNIFHTYHLVLQPQNDPRTVFPIIRK